MFISDVGHELLARHENSPFVAMYFDTKEGGRVYSLRSHPEFDCSVVAKRFGGGGHAQAAGFNVSCDTDVSQFPD